MGWDLIYLINDLPIFLIYQLKKCQSFENDGVLFQLVLCFYLDYCFVKTDNDAGFHFRSLVK